MSANSYRSYTPVYNFSSTAINTNDGAYQSMSLGMSWVWENTLSYKYSFQQNNFSFLVGESAERDGLGESMSGSNALGLYSDFAHAYLSNYPNVSSTLTTVQGSPWGIGGLLSYFGRLNYDYKGTYLFSAMARSDGSSNFNVGHRWGTFPSFSAGWIMTNESFMKDINGLDFLKIRGSWGENGNNAIPAFQYLSQIGTCPAVGSVYPNYFFGADNKSISSVGSYPSQMANLNIKWETSVQTDLGLDAAFLNNRLSFTFDWYKKVTKDWLVQAPIPAVDGTGAPYINGGNIENRGYEFNLGWRDHIGAFRYNISGNISFNHNEVTRIANGSGYINGQSNVFGSTDVWYRAQVGYPIGYFYGYKTDGIFQNQAQIKAYVDPKTGMEIMPNAVPGDVKFVDLNGNGTIDGNDRTEIGNPNPAYNYGVTASCEYKGFDFALVGTGVGGNQIAQCTDFEDPILSNNTTDIFARWHGEGSSNFLPRVTASPTINTQYFSSIYMRSGAYFRISNVTLGYDFKKLFPVIPVSKARLYVQIQNLYTFTKYTGMDPQVSYAPDSWASGVDIGQYPSARTVLVGVNIKF
jgi:TonB-linked SusC/RagA family outer membrane protein